MCRSGVRLQSAATAQHRGMRRFARRRRTLAAFTAIMGRLGRAAAAHTTSAINTSGTSGGMRSAFKVHYRKLVEEPPSPTKKQRRDEDTTSAIGKSAKKRTSSSQHVVNVELPADCMSYCCCRCGHTQKLKAEELNTIVGNAFRMAYVAQLQRQPMLHDVISPKSAAHFRKDKHEQQEDEGGNHSVWNTSLSDTANNNNNNTNNNNNNKTGVLAVGNKSIVSSSSSSSGSNTCSGSSSSSSGSSGDDRSSVAASPTGDMNLSASCSPTLRLSSVKTPNSIPGLRPSHNFGGVLGTLHHEDGCGGGGGGGGNNGANGAQQSQQQKSCSQQSTPSSDESNSPTELNSYKRLTDKPPLIKRLAMGLTGGRDVLGLNVGGEDDSCPLVVSGGSTPTSPTTTRPHSGGYINEAIIDSEPTTTSRYGKLLPATESLDNTINSSINAKNFNRENNRLAQSSTESDFKSKRRSQLSTSSSSAAPADGSTLGSTPTPPPLPERHDSLSFRNEEAELRRAPWFQAGIPREITLEVLSQEPEGAFMVRESTSKPGCYALSLRVPRDFQPSGIAHYLIMRIAKGYKIKGFTKEFTTLTSLITHHSVMPELLPCPLSLSRYNPSFVKADSSKDFADIDSDPDYNTLADFRKMMADLNV